MPRENPNFDWGGDDGVGILQSLANTYPEIRKVLREIGTTLDDRDRRIADHVNSLLRRVRTEEFLPGDGVVINNTSWVQVVTTKGGLSFAGLEYPKALKRSNLHVTVHANCDFASLGAGWAKLRVIAVDTTLDSRTQEVAMISTPAAYAGPGNFSGVCKIAQDLKPGNIRLNVQGRVSAVGASIDFKVDHSAISISAVESL